MKIYYLSEQRFVNQIIKRWQKNRFNYNAGHLNILKYSFRAVQYWASLEGQKISEVNKIDIHPKLF